ncbi:MAG: signal peptidase II [Candidatus Omnitrophica bacterium]|nr:signal peptidase II [Candidatus Omnitrophota bacterium]
MPERKRKKIILLLSFILLLDQATKLYFSSRFSPGESLPIIKNILHFTLVFNTGAAFGIFKDQASVFVLIGILAVCFIIFNLRRDGASGRWALLLILAGAIGNLIDRARLGYVIDFIDFRVWPVFNIADSAITIGAVWLFISAFLRKQKA